MVLRHQHQQEWRRSGCRMNGMAYMARAGHLQGTCRACSVCSNREVFLDMTPSSNCIHTQQQETEDLLGDLDKACAMM